MSTYIDLLNKWLGVYEPLWLLLVLTFESLMGLVSAYVLILEFKYDKAFNEHMKSARKDRRRKKYEECKLPEQNLTDGEMK